MIRLYVNSALISGQSVILPDSQVHYLLHVMRQKEGDSVLLFNGKDGEWLASIQSLNKKQGLVIPQKQARIQSVPSPVFLCPALIKKEPMDWVLQKATELGISDIYPLLTERTVVSKLNMERSQSLLIEAAEQSERLTIPTLHQPQKLPDFLKNLPAEVHPVCLSERGETALQPASDQTAALCIGPEGGWTQAELTLFEKKQASFWHLGDTILRAETAAVAAVACYRFSR